MSSKPYISIVGGGLAGSEAAWQAAKRGINVKLYEMRPKVSTGAHKTSDLAELVCSNSLGSKLPDRASGILQNELRYLDSIILKCAKIAAIPAGSALAVDRTIFSHSVTEIISSHPNIEVIRQEIKEIPDEITIIASGPLTSRSFSKSIADLTGTDNLHFYDAISPIVDATTINFEVAYRGSRYGKGELEGGDYINCPFNQEQYDAFVDALVEAERIPLRDFEKDIKNGFRSKQNQYFESCLPVEIIAERGNKSLAFGPMRPTGLTNPHTGNWPVGVVQLRQDNIAGNLYNMVGFQTNLTFGEQNRIFRMVPGMEKAEFIRFGQMHRNTFISSPLLLLPTLQFRKIPRILFAGQITGIEGYLGNIASGLLAGINASFLVLGKIPLELSKSTMLGALCYYVSHADMEYFQPMKANLSILENLDKINRSERRHEYAKRSFNEIRKYKY